MALDEANLEQEYYSSENTGGAWATSFNLDGVSYATNLFWQPLQNPDDVFPELEQASENILEGADLYCIKQGKSPQFGLCISEEGFLKSQNVAAASVANYFSDMSSFVGVFKVDAGWWYICVRNDIILSDGDMLFVNEDDAKAQFESMMAVPDWGKKIAPAEWAVEDVEEGDLSLILAGSASVKLQRIKSLKGGKLMIVFVISGFIGLWALYALIDAMFLTPKVKPVTVAPVRRPAPIAAQPQVELPKPWEKVIAYKDVAQKCSWAVGEFISVMPPGWNGSAITCSDSSASSSWSKQIGRVSWAKEAIERKKNVFSTPSFNSTGTNVSASISFGSLPTRSSPPTYNLSDLTFQINDLFQSLGVNVSLGNEKITVTSGASSDKNRQTKVYNLLTFRFSSTQSPVEWNAILSKFSGLFIKKIIYNPANGGWNYEGAIYVL